jgi:hypothetical protein
MVVHFCVAVSAETSALLCVAAKRFPHVTSWVFGAGIALPYANMVDLVVAVTAARAMSDTGCSFSFNASQVSEPSEGDSTHVIRLLGVARTTQGLRVTITSMHSGVARELLRLASTAVRPVLGERVQACLETRTAIIDATVSIQGNIFKADKLGKSALLI